MSKYIILLCSLFLSMITFAQDTKFRLAVNQGGKSIKEKDNVYLLEPKTFVLQMAARNVEGFLVGATFDRDVYMSAIGEGDLEVSWFSETGMAEELFNADQSMFISNDAPSYWYYDSEDDHRFDRDPKGNLTDWIGNRTIRQFDDLLNEKTIQVDTYQGSVFLFIYKPEYDDEYNMVSMDILFHGELKFAKK
ncbi:hypothetical protein [Sphingobacterium bovistauri]|uniref:Uncharacterized protein n=1 Tax=Sphingobacterium bovistauri TaxID=2781959 RepID=A0ABS7ZAW9_9SPHI|nr:hypothetical protein [Sphingobacterium bovistauri]MCA5005834.1 hypothetical protein [Sphingobacterium bovistauri]